MIASKEPMGQFVPNLSQNFYLPKLIEVCSNEGQRQFSKECNVSLEKKLFLRRDNSGLYIQGKYINDIWKQSSPEPLRRF